MEAWAAGGPSILIRQQTKSVLVLRLIQMACATSEIFLSDKQR